jgi:simple sugar transport system substrate-binding protein
VFTGPIYDQGGALKVKDGQKMGLGDLATIDWYVKGIQSA